MILGPPIISCDGFLNVLNFHAKNNADSALDSWTAMWLIFWVITNVATGFYSLDLVPHFYYWGYAWPLHQGTSTLFSTSSVMFSHFPFTNDFPPAPPAHSSLEGLLTTPTVVEASHQLLFDLHSRIGLNIGILLIWVVVNTILFAPACYLMRWEQQRAKAKEVQKEKEWLQAMSKTRTRIGIPK